MPAACRVVALALALAGAAGRAIAQPADDSAGRSRALHEQAKDAYQRGEYQRAARLFREAHELSPDPALLFNQAQAHRFAGECAEAARIYRQYLAARPQADNRAHVEEKVAEMDACAERAAATSAPPPVAAMATRPSAVSPTDDGAPRPRLGLWIAGGGAVALGAAGVFWYRAWDADARIDDRIAAGGTWDASWEDLESRRGRDQVIATISTGVAVAALAGGLVYHLAFEPRRANLSARIEPGGGASIVYAHDL